MASSSYWFIVICICFDWSRVIALVSVLQQSSENRPNCRFLWLLSHSSSCPIGHVYFSKLWIVKTALTNLKTGFHTFTWQFKEIQRQTSWNNQLIFERTRKETRDTKHEQYDKPDLNEVLSKIMAWTSLRMKINVHLSLQTKRQDASWKNRAALVTITFSITRFWPLSEVSYKLLTLNSGVLLGVRMVLKLWCSLAKWHELK